MTPWLVLLMVLLDLTMRTAIRMVAAVAAGVNVDDPDEMEQAERSGSIAQLDALEGSKEKSLLAAMQQKFN